jgi:HlyD family secretion protein
VRQFPVQLPYRFRMTSYYTARVLLKPEELAKLGSAKLVPGMPIDVFIKTPGGTALSYLIKPLQDQAERAFKKR